MSKMLPKKRKASRVRVTTLEQGSHNSVGKQKSGKMQGFVCPTPFLALGSPPGYPGYPSATQNVPQFPESSAIFNLAIESYDRRSSPSYF